MVRTAAKKVTEDAEVVRALVAALDTESARLLAEAAQLRATMLDQLDGAYPSEEMRADAARLTKLAGQLRAANQVRPFVEQEA